MDIFKIVNLNRIKEQYKIETFTLIDFTVGFDDSIYMLFSQKVPERINGMFVDTKASTRYIAIVLLFNWNANTILHQSCYDFGELEFNYHFIRPLGTGFLLLGARCRYYSKDNVENNALLISADGNFTKAFCLGDGIEDCITTTDNRIITSYFDEGVFGNYGWVNPIGNSGLIVWNDDGNIIWKNEKYDICDCYAINIDTSNRLWFYYYTNFELVCTDFNLDFVMNSDLNGCNSFAISERQKEIIFSGGYNDKSFYLCDLNIQNGKIGGKHEIQICVGQVPLKMKAYHFRGSKLLFLTESDVLCGYHFIS